MTFVERATKLLELSPKFKVFPLCPHSKLPAIKSYATEATRDLAKIELWGRRFPDGNVGIPTDELAVIDVDNKGEKKGSNALIGLELEGKTLPETFEQRTPTGGAHLIFDTPHPIKQGVSVLGPGLDIRGKGGYVVGAGSVTSTGVYEAVPRPIVSAPEWLIESCGRPKERQRDGGNLSPLSGVEPTRAARRATHYLVNEAPLASQGNGGDQITFAVACRVKDLGCDPLTCLELMLEHWNERCSPPWGVEELGVKVENAYQYGFERPGVSDPGTEFSKVEELKVEELKAEELKAEELKAEERKLVLHPFEELNKEFAYVISGGRDHILWETKDETGAPAVDHWDIESFHRALASKTMVVSGKEQQISKLWIKDPRRRSYRGICFSPGKTGVRGSYNLWKGFSVEPLTPGEKPTERGEAALSSFIEHAHENVCAKNDELTKWLLGYFAHIVQSPWEKPLVALVLKGRKGVGKNALVERVGALLGPHAITIANRRYFLSNFNSVLENKILVTLDEAFWSGDKTAEGILKDLITAPKHTIERKGKEPYTVTSCLRLAILGNEDWLVPASQDERRYAVFNVGEGRKQDDEFFEKMRTGMEAGGYRLLLRYLMDFDLSGIKVGRAPKTEALLEQKHQSLNPLHQWWKDSLIEGRLVGLDFSGDWPHEIQKDQVRDALQKEWRARGIFSWFPTAENITKELKRCLPSIFAGQKRIEGDRRAIYRFPSLERARKEWEEFIGHPVEWPLEDGEDLLA